MSNTVQIFRHRIFPWFPKFITKNPASASNFPSQIWEILIVFDLVQKSWSCLILSRFCKFITKVSSTNHSALSRGVNNTIEEDPTIWWLNRADWEIVIYIGWAWQGQISSNLVSTGCQSEHIMLCQQVWRMMLLRRIMPWATWLRLSTAIMHYWLPCKIWSAMEIHIWDIGCESLHILLCQQVWIMMLMRNRMLLCWWPNMADWEVGMHSGCAWQGQISSTMVSIRQESYQILLCQ